MTRNIKKPITMLVAALGLVAWAQPIDPLKLTAESRLWVDGTSSVRSFSCKATVVDAVAEVGAANSVSAVLGGENAVKTVNLTVQTDKMDCGNGTMNGHMMKAIKGKDNPTIAFKLESYALAKGSAATTATLKGSLTLGGVTKPITLEASLTPGANGALRVAGAYELNMKDYDLTPPSLMMGTLKVRENVKVNFDLALR